MTVSNQSGITSEQRVDNFRNAPKIGASGTTGYREGVAPATLIQSGVRAETFDAGEGDAVQAIVAFPEAFAAIPVVTIGVIKLPTARASGADYNIKIISRSKTQFVVSINVGAGTTQELDFCWIAIGNG